MFSHKATGYLIKEIRKHHCSTYVSYMYESPPVVRVSRYSIFMMDQRWAKLCQSLAQRCNHTVIGSTSVLSGIQMLAGVHVDRWSSLVHRWANVKNLPSLQSEHAVVGSTSVLFGIPMLAEFHVGPILADRWVVVAGSPLDNVKACHRLPDKMTLREPLIPTSTNE